ncbi:MAG: tetratricopeptide repeat protein [Acidobacteria bacterium]|nr:tetratricopeptide repeat protein [Acidobacteriota bacterium]
MYHESRSVRSIEVRSILLLMFALAAGCGERIGSLPAPSTEMPVIVISIDTLRSDRLPVYGYTGVSTPNIDAFRQDAILYEHAYSHYPLTLPSHTSMFTGRLPSAHGIRDNMGYQLREDVPTVAELLKQNGYATGAAVSAYVLRPESGIGRGFDMYDDDVEKDPDQPSVGMMQRQGRLTTRIATEWIRKHSETPFFFFLHLYEPHAPYMAPEPYKSMYEDPYDGEIAYTDAIIGDFVADLKSMGIYDDALILLLADHGEGLGDHGEQTHGLLLYREVLQVPLMVKLPGSSLGGETVGTSVQLADVFPTILERTGIPWDESAVSARSLVGLVGNEPEEPRPIYSETYYPRLHFGWSELHSLIDGRHHYIEGPESELYALQNDLGETKNVLEDERRVYFAMRDAIEPFVVDASAPTEVDPEEAAKLAALGYLGTTVKTEPGEKLPHPKYHVATVDDINLAFQKFREDEFQESLALIEKHLDANQNMVDLWSLRAKVLRRLGQPEEAIESARRALELSPTMSYLALHLARLYLDDKQFDQAEDHAELAIKQDPEGAYDVLAQVSIERKDLKTAEKRVRLAMEHEGENAIHPLMTLARIKRDQGELDAALEILDRAFSEKEPKQRVHSLYFIRGDVYARLGYAKEAERDFREEIRLFPHEQQTYKNLMLLLVAQGRIEDATQLIHDLIDASPTPPSYIAISEALDVLGDDRSARYWARRGLQQFPNNRSLRKLASGTAGQQAG